jgi:hypothetical protein
MSCNNRAKLIDELNCYFVAPLQCNSSWMEKKHCNILLILLNGVIASMYQVLKDSSEDVTLQGSNNSNQIILRTRGHKKEQFGRDKD